MRDREREREKERERERERERIRHLAGVNASSQSLLRFVLTCFPSIGMTVFHCHFTNMCFGNYFLFLSVDDLDISPDFTNIFRPQSQCFTRTPVCGVFQLGRTTEKFAWCQGEAGQRSKVQCIINKIIINK